MNEDALNNCPVIPIAVRCDRCMRIVGYKIVAGTGRIQIKCPKCGQIMIVDLSMRKAKQQVFYRRVNSNSLNRI